MGSKSLSQEYDFTEGEESPVRTYKPLRSRVNMDTRNTDRILVEKANNVEFNETKTEKINAGENEDPNFSRGQRKVIYMCSKYMVDRADQMIKVPKRASLVSSLIDAYSLNKYLSIVEPRPATFDELCVFHSPDYLEFLKKISEQEDDEKYDEEAQHYGLSYDCAVHQGVYDYTRIVSGASIQAAQYLINQAADIAINWYGGWHHGKKDFATGFCYTNDVVLAILKLREKFSRVLYVDLDLHHGDGVEDAFSSTNKVMTVSVHKYAVGFFPGSGSVRDVGYGKGKYYSVNIPLKDGIKDAEFAALVCRILVKVKEKFDPETVVCQCGADGLAGDPNESFNLTPLSLGKCVYTLLSWKLPILLLGGGGYNPENTARCWTYLTGVAVGRKLSNDLPEHKYLMNYGPGYELSVAAGNKRDQNSQEYLQSIYSDILYNLNQLPSGLQ